MALCSTQLLVKMWPQSDRVIVTPINFNSASDRVILTQIIYCTCWSADNGAGWQLAAKCVTAGQPKHLTDHQQQRETCAGGACKQCQIWHERSMNLWNTDTRRLIKNISLLGSSTLDKIFQMDGRFLGFKIHSHIFNHSHLPGMERGLLPVRAETSGRQNSKVGFPIQHSWRFTILRRHQWPRVKRVKC